MNHAVLGETRPDPIGEMLAEMFKTENTGFIQFQNSFGISGLAKEVDGTLEILAVEASEPGTGQFRKFINLAKNTYPRILILEVWNKTLDKTLERYGFTKWEAVEEGEKLTGREWKKPE